MSAPVSSASRIYFDHNATTPLSAAARTAMLPWLDAGFGNASSIHAEGRAARHAVEEARRSVAELIGAAFDEIVFTSGGTESDHLAIRAALAIRRADVHRNVVVTTAIEHPAVHGAVASLAREGFDVRLLPVDSEAQLDIAALGLDQSVALVSAQAANHELGAVLPVAAIAAPAKAAGAWLHCDAVQLGGKGSIDVAALGVDLLSLSAHKLGGPKGVGALYIRRGRAIEPLFVGHQERGQRAGTENVAGVVGFGAAARDAILHGAARRSMVTALRDRLEEGARRLGARVNGVGGLRVGNTSNLSFEGVEAELLVAALDLAGVAVSTGAACSSGSVEPSPVLLALGQSVTRAKEAVRFSLGESNTAAEVDRVLALLPSLIERVRSS